MNGSQKTAIVYIFVLYDKKTLYSTHYLKPHNLFHSHPSYFIVNSVWACTVNLTMVWVENVKIVAIIIVMNIFCNVFVIRELLIKPFCKF